MKSTKKTLALLCASISLFTVSGCGQGSHAGAPQLNTSTSATSSSSTHDATKPSESRTSSMGTPINTGSVKMTGSGAESSTATSSDSATRDPNNHESRSSDSGVSGTSTSRGSSINGSSTTSGSATSGAPGTRSSSSAATGGAAATSGSAATGGGSPRATGASVSHGTPGVTPATHHKGATSNTSRATAAHGAPSSAASTPHQSGKHTTVATHGTRSNATKTGSAQPSSRSSSSTPPASSSTNLGPNRISIPSLGINMPLVDVGVSGGQMGVPDNYSQLGRWTGSAPIGSSNGRAIIDGHIWGPLGKIANMNTGTVVYISDGSGHTYRFIARSRYEVNKHAVSADTFYGSGPMQVSLITCGGRVRYYASDNMLRHDDNVIVTLTRG